MFYNQNNINIYGFQPQPKPQQQLVFNNDIYSNNNYFINNLTDKKPSITSDSLITNSCQNNKNLNISNFPKKSPQNSFLNITEESINEYMENFKKMRLCKENNESSKKTQLIKDFNHVEQKEIKSFKQNYIPNKSSNHDISNSNTSDNTPPTETNSNKISNEINKDQIISPFTFNENGIEKKMVSASLSYYFDINPKIEKNFKLNLFDNYPYKFENSDKIKLFDDNNENNLFYNTAKIIDIKSESEEETKKYQDFFGPHRSNINFISR